MPRPRKRALGLLGGALLLFFLGTNVQAGWLYVLSAILLGTIVAGTVLPATGLRGLEAEIEAPSESTQGAEALVTVRLRTTRRSSRWSILVEDEHLGSVRSFVPGVRPDETVEVTTLRTASRRGIAMTTSVRVRTTFPFGVAERSVRLPAEASTLVVPATVALGPLALVHPVATVERAEHRSPRRGSGPDYLAIREYRPGDSMRHVHWPSTARHGTVMVREFEEERTRRLAVVLDVSRDADPPGDGPTPLDLACTAAGSVALAAAASGHGARMIADAAAEDGPEVRSRLDEGPLLRWLARLEAGTARPFPDVLDGLRSDDLRGIETVVAITPWLSGDDGARLTAAAGGLAAQVDTLVLVLVLPGAGPEAAPGDGMGNGPHELTARASAVASISAAGVDVRVWEPGRALEEVLA